MSEYRAPARVRLPRRSSRRWAIAAGVAACWVVLWFATGSAVSAAIVLLAVAGIGAAGFAGLRAMGASRPRRHEEPRWHNEQRWDEQRWDEQRWDEQRWDEQRWHDGHDGFQTGFVSYREAGADHEPDASMTVADGMATIKESALAPVPVLRLVTGSSTVRTRMSGARAGRGNVELALPDVPTVSREHAKFTFSDGRWWVKNLGINGITLNGTPLAGEQPISDGDTIRWGTRPDSLLTRIELG